MSYEYMMGLGTAAESIDMDFATPETLLAAGITSPPAVSSTPVTKGEDSSLIEDIEAGFASLWDKMNASDQTQIAAEDIAREEGGIAKMEMETATVAAPAAAPAAAPPASVVVDPEPSWAARYAPFMILGGLGVGAVVVLVLAMRKKKDRPSW